MTLLVVTIVVALAFDFTNGFHDTANAVATSVSTRALSPRMAVLIAAIATQKTVLDAEICASASNLLTCGF